mmetsp:Transcript_46991/g.142293  ORF Transcript_46991/g.142293 Transcript_46991/m.142293 type:complete len:81 (-) Transcript_46991:14-256(-)
MSEKISTHVRISGGENMDSFPPGEYQCHFLHNNLYSCKQVYVVNAVHRWGIRLAFRMLCQLHNGPIDSFIDHLDCETNNL